MTTAKPKRSPRALDEAAAQVLARRNTRRLLADFLPEWEHVWTIEEPDGTVQINRGDEFVVRFRWADLRKTLPADSYRLVGKLFELLTEQATFASWATHVAKIELGTHAKRGAGPGDARSRAAEARATGVATAARKLLATNPRLTTSDIARQLSERGHGGFHSLRRKLPKLLG